TAAASSLASTENVLPHAGHLILLPISDSRICSFLPHDVYWVRIGMRSCRAGCNEGAIVLASRPSPPREGCFRDALKDHNIAAPSNATNATGTVMLAIHSA